MGGGPLKYAARTTRYLQAFHFPSFYICAVITKFAVDISPATLIALPHFQHFLGWLTLWVMYETRIYRTGR